VEDTARPSQSKQQLDRLLVCATIRITSHPFHPPDVFPPLEISRRSTANVIQLPPRPTRRVSIIATTPSTETSR
jgi:hypothetical protein